MVRTNVDTEDDHCHLQVMRTHGGRPRESRFTASRQSEDVDGLGGRSVRNIG